MATDFFERQSKARQNTAWLVSMFLLATFAIVACTFIVTLLAVSYQSEYRSAIYNQSPTTSYMLPTYTSVGALALVLGGTLYKVTELRAGGGATVAEHLGGKLLRPDSTDLGERRLLNVVEEMAIASGVPVPPVYLLDEAGINAFAAGYATGDAVLGVTRGAVDQLNREQLQGVIAHEFSHILNGDMRMSIRLIGILHGILLLGLLGQLVLRSMAYSSGGRNRDRGQTALVLLGIGVTLFVLGYVGTFLGGLIKAAVSRQREYLADASAVQFTRNPSGIAGALKQIGATLSGSKLKTPAAVEASHMFFAQGVWEGLTGLMATHPPLNKRILAIEPNWNGKFPKPQSQTVHSVDTSGAAGFMGAASTATSDAGSTLRGLDLALLTEAVNQVGDPQEVHREYAAKLIESLPEEVRAAARETYGARAVIYCLLLDSRKEVRQKQVAALREKADHGVLREASKLQNLIARIDPRARLPLVDLSMPALRMMSAGQFQDFSACLHALIVADGNLGLFEWTLGRIVARHLEPQYTKQRNVVTLYYGLQRLGPECSMLLSTMAHVGHNPANAERAFAAAAPLLPKLELRCLPREECSLAQLPETLDKLSRCTAKLRGQLLDACAEVVCADGEVKLEEAELIRGIADLLDCPVPPLIAGQDVEASALFRGHRS
ncbi:M48 family metallopeptidase [Aeoliella mucimassa]|uniref:Peptidase M48 domain-containing protein n=1 Tax=Aeoliella mucimassa TaxID=2527972 RepID=A0A518AJI0_9BACT|nr:M48 family metallopeptidase [Aeoliella mucimassa]QDU54846.1 hypothetical protein Pan181_10300 [Aeoliella mucimassa]